MGKDTSAGTSNPVVHIASPNAFLDSGALRIHSFFHSHPIGHLAFRVFLSEYSEWTEFSSLYVDTPSPKFLLLLIPLKPLLGGFPKLFYCLEQTLIWLEILWNLQLAWMLYFCASLYRNTVISYLYSVRSPERTLIWKMMWLKLLSRNALWLPKWRAREKRNLQVAQRN